MKAIDKLLKIGYSESEIKQLIAEEKIIIINNEIFVNDFDVLIEIAYKTDDKFILRNYTDIQTGLKLFELFRLIRLGKAELVYKLAERMYEEDKIPEAKIIIDNLELVEDDIEYIIEENYYDNKDIVKKYKEMEIDMLLDYYCGDFKSASEKMSNICSLYCYQNPIPFKAYITYLKKIEELKLNNTKINERNTEGAIGDPLAVITALINCNDFYRAHNILNEYYIQNGKEFSVIFEILRLLDQRLMSLLKNNERDVRKQIELKANGLNDAHEVIGTYNLSSISNEIVDALESNKEEIDESVNYIKLYDSLKKKHKYKEAKVALNKYLYIQNKDREVVNFDYLVYELNVLDYNYQNMNEEDRKIRDTELKKGEKLIEKGKYGEALPHLLEAIKKEPKKSPLILSKIGECYVKEGKYFDAYLAFKLEENEYLYPDDYLYIVECLYKIGITDRAELYVNKYENYYHISDAFMHYILSIIHLENGDYQKAEEEIGICEIIKMEETNLALIFRNERNILHNLMNGRKAEPYSIYNYYSHCYSDEEVKKLLNIDIESYEDGELKDVIFDYDLGDNLVDKIEFLLTVYKVVKEMNRIQDAKDLLFFLRLMIKTGDITEKERDSFTVVLENYRHL